jgi:hypothetical protein
MRAVPRHLGFASLLASLTAACIPTRLTYYELTAGADGRNATHCALGVRDQSEVKVGPGVRVRISGADPRTQTATLSAAVELLVYEGHRVQFASDTFTISTESPERVRHITPEAISSRCYDGPLTCGERLAVTDVLEGRSWPGSGLFPDKQPRAFQLNLVVEVTAADAFSVQLAPLSVDGGEPVTLPAVRFQKVTKTTVAGVCP